MTIYTRGIYPPKEHAMLFVGTVAVAEFFTGMAISRHNGDLLTPLGALDAATGFGCAVTTAKAINEDKKTARMIASAMFVTAAALWGTAQYKLGNSNAPHKLPAMTIHHFQQNCQSITNNKVLYDQKLNTLYCIRPSENRIVASFIPTSKPQ